MTQKAWDDDTARVVRARAGAPAAGRRIVAAAGLLVIGVAVALGVAHAGVATAADVAACNQEAREGFRNRAASPTPKDEAAAATARTGAPATAERPEATGSVTRSRDPQIDGMDTEGAKDAAYRATYRICMRKKGF